MKDKILVTGGAGFIGSHIVDKLCEQGYEVFNIDDLSGGFKRNINPNCRFIKLDLRNKVKVEKVIKKIKPKYIFYLASCAREGASQFQPLYVTETNYMAYMNTLVPAIKYGLKKIVTFSSMSVYGAQQTPFSEEMERKPEDIYAISKSAMERATEILSSVHGFDYVILRPHNVFGERQSMEDKFRNVIAIFMNRFLRNEPIYIYGDGEQKRAFSYIEDSLPCYIRCLSPEISKEIINIGGKSPVTINNLAYNIKRWFKFFPASKSEVVYLPDRPCEVKIAYCTTKKSERLLGYKESVGWSNGVEEMVSWAKSMGPQKWVTDKMEIVTKAMPKIWR